MGCRERGTTRPRNLYPGFELRRVPAYTPIYGDGIYGRNPNPGHEIAIIDLASRDQTQPVQKPQTAGAKSEESPSSPAYPLLRKALAGSLAGSPCSAAVSSRARLQHPECARRYL
jgi:hypothetical protein